jgi:hypothetical protein
MAKSRAKKAKLTKSHARKGVTTGVKRFKASSGKYAQVRVLDANTASFGTDLLDVFRSNVAKARRENKRLFGSPDRARDGN